MEKKNTMMKLRLNTNQPHNKVIDRKLMTSHPVNTTLQTRATIIKNQGVIKSSNSMEQVEAEEVTEIITKRTPNNHTPKPNIKLVRVAMEEVEAEEEAEAAMKISQQETHTLIKSTILHLNVSYIS